MKNIFSILALVLIIASCSNPKNEHRSDLSSAEAFQAIDIPLPNVKPGSILFTIDPSIDNVLTTEKGSKITIPKGTLVDASGNPVTEKVEIQFEEFHDAKDIILSGIPMNFTTENGEMGSFESAGMFNISASFNGEEARIGNGKNVEVELASFREESDFNFYQFDKEEGKWIDNGLAEAPVPNEDKETLLASLMEDEPQRPIEIKKATSTDKVFDLAVDKNRNPEFAAFDNVMWKLADQESNLDSRLFSGVLRNPKLQCIDNAKSVFTLTGFSGNKRLKAKVQPVLFGSNWKKAKAQFQAKMTEYKAEVEVQKEKRKKVERMASVTRTIQLSNFGTFNFDRLYHLKRKVQFNALFFIPALKKVFKKGWLIQGNEKIAIPYSRTGYYKFTFDPKVDNTVITFDEEGNLYEFTADDFTKNAGAFPSENQEYTFKMRETGVIVDDPDDLEEYLATL